MSRFHSYIRTAGQLLAGYDGSLPFAPYAKAFFAREKKYGSTDRRHISTLCYHYFRVAKALPGLAEADTLLAATFLCEQQPGPLLQSLRPEWNAAVQEPLEKKIALLPVPFAEASLFPFADALSKEIDSASFIRSFLVQPLLYLRARPGQQEVVLQKLSAAHVPVMEVAGASIALPNGTKVEDAITLNKEAVVQDYSSQQTGGVLQAFALRHLPQVNAWDCCAASGGKSLLLHDLRPDATLTVSDIRASILHNLEQRFRQAGIGGYRSLVADVAAPGFRLAGGARFNLVVADVPCTGSGTWARTPEQAYFFTADKLAEYTRRQRKILSNLLPHLQSGGYLVYITCSVFAAENEDQVLPLTADARWQLLTLQYLKGYTCQADTLFIAVLRKS